MQDGNKAAAAEASEKTTRRYRRGSFSSAFPSRPEPVVRDKVLRTIVRTSTGSDPIIEGEEPVDRPGVPGQTRDNGPVRRAIRREPRSTRRGRPFCSKRHPPGRATGRSSVRRRTSSVSIALLDESTVLFVFRLRQDDERAGRASVLENGPQRQAPLSSRMSLRPRGEDGENAAAAKRSRAALSISRRKSRAAEGQPEPGRRRGVLESGRGVGGRHPRGPDPGARSRLPSRHRLSGRAEGAPRG